MASDTFSRYLCLKLDRIGAVINAEAVSVEQPMFLATHTPMTGIAVDERRWPEAIERVDEAGALAALRAAARDDRHALMVVKGVQGTGKSHLVRWLRERYAAGRRPVDGGGPAEVVLLIERSSNSLRGTILQLLASGVFDDATSDELLGRMRDATDALNDAQLDNHLLNNLQVGAVDATLPDGTPVPPRIHRHLREFLLDLVAREYLSRDDGPIDRIRRFLTDGRGPDAGPADAPEFTAADLDLPLSVRQAISRDGNRGAKALADDLADREPMRGQTARLLNALLPAAIQRTTALSGDDLRTIFLDLRRRLRREGKGLVLFIEDVTTFTGIDAALMEVLVTQHTGEANRDLCRMTSVVGVTDAFYLDRVPDNVKDRVTHLVALSARGSDATQLATPGAVADLVGRYLNALRLEPGEVEAWAGAGADPDSLPNACDRCPYRPVCHPAFGAVSDHPDDPEPRIGLYPFNETALWAMFDRLDPARVVKTPRSLLRSVVQYVLQSHARLIPEGGFPPPPDRLGEEFDVPPLRDGFQARAIDQQAGTRARSVESLIRVWGDRTITAIDGDGGRVVGGLPEAVFTAFDLPAIRGEGVGPPPRPLDDDPTIEQRPTPTPDPPIPPIPPVTPPAVESREAQRINAWREGQQLQGANDLATWVADFFRTGIDWERHHVPAHLVGERIQAGRIRFEGQATAGSRTGQLPFERSDEVAYALLALHTLRSPHAVGEEGRVGGAVALLSGWLRRHEERVVEFVRRPALEAPEPMPLVRAAVRASVALAALRGAVTASDFDNMRELFAAVIEHAVKDRRSTPSEEEWAAELESIAQRFPTAWAGVPSRIRGRLSPTNLQSQLRHSLDLGRGGTTSERSAFLDAATALDELGAAQADGWRMRALDPERGTWTASWVQVADAWTALRTYLGDGVAEGRAQIVADRERLDAIVGDADATAVERAVKETISVLRALQLPYHLDRAQTLRSEDITNARQRSAQVAAAPDDLRLAAALASTSPSVAEVRRTVEAADEFATFVDRELDRIARDPRHAELEAGAEATEIARTKGAFADLLALLEGDAPEVVDEGDRP